MEKIGSILLDYVCDFCGTPRSIQYVYMVLMRGTDYYKNPLKFIFSAHQSRSGPSSRCDGCNAFLAFTDLVSTKVIEHEKK